MITAPVRFLFGPAHRVRLPNNSGADRPLRGNTNGNCRPLRRHSENQFDRV